jgi:hypothetical protein
MTQSGRPARMNTVRAGLKHACFPEGFFLKLYNTLFACKKDCFSRRFCV